MELNFGPDETEPQIRFDLDEHTTWEELMQAIDRGIPVSKQALYTRYGVPEPGGEEDVFVKHPQSGMDPLSLAMADAGKKKPGDRFFSSGRR